MDIDLSKPIMFGGNQWKCKSAISKRRMVFLVNDHWNYCENTELNVQDEMKLTEVEIAVYQKVKTAKCSLQNELFWYTGAELEKLRNLIGDRHKETPQRKDDRHISKEDRHKSKEDRHKETSQRKDDRHKSKEDRRKETPQRKDDRHKSKEDRHKETPQRKDDRHKSKEDRHKETPQRKDDRHKSKEDRHKSKEDRHKSKEERKEYRKIYQKKYNQRKLENGILNDTGMDLICCSCVEWKSVASCKSIDKIPSEKAVKYLVETDLTQNSDGKFYVCETCKTSIDKNIEPRRAQKEILGFLSFPAELKKVLEIHCKPKNEEERDDAEQKYLKLNRLEDHLLKQVIPFIRIGHLPRGQYFQVKGVLIMISANVEESLNKILPVDQNLVPVSFKKKLEYSGHYIQEYVDKKKVLTYFNWFKKYNHLYKDYELDVKLITDYENSCM